MKLLFDYNHSTLLLVKCKRARNDFLTFVKGEDIES